MYIFNFIVLWLYYSKIYILGSLFVTYLLNKVTRKFYLPPLIINMVSVILLFFSQGDKAYAMYINYVPVVLSSSIMNIVIYIIRRKNNVR